MKTNKSFIWLSLFVGGLWMGCSEDPMEEKGFVMPEPENTVSQTYDGIYPGVIHVKFKSGSVAEALSKRTRSTAVLASAGIPEFDEITQKYKVQEVSRIFPYWAKFEAKDKKYGFDRWYQIKYEPIATRSEDKAAESIAIVEELAALPEIEIAEPACQMINYGGEAEIRKVVSSLKAVGNNLPFNDPLLKNQWHYDAAVSSHLADANIHVFDAWKVNTGNRNVIVAVNDVGVDYEHEDLAANMWINETEKNGVTFIDDDQNGYFDDIYGYNFAQMKGRISPGDHGTHVAGTIGAVNNNGVGVCGIAGGSGHNDGVRLMSCQIFVGSMAGSALGAMAAQALRYSANMGAVISQNSWGYGKPNIKEQVLLDAIDYFIAEAGNYPGSPMKGGVFITSSGNKNSGADYYPGAYEPCITVASTDYQNHRSSFSNYGNHIDLSAPGGSDISNREELDILSTFPGNDYGYMAGTSMACPHVSGIAALLISRYGGAGFTNEKLKEMLLAATHPLDQWEPDYMYMGKGIIDAGMALRSGEGEDQKIAPEAVKDLELIKGEGDGMSLQWKITKDEDDGVPAAYRVYWSKEELTAANYTQADYVLYQLIRPVEGNTVTCPVPWGESRGSWYAVVVGADRAGNISGISNLVYYTSLAADAVKTWPNPVKNVLNIQSGENYFGSVSLQFFDASGRLVANQEYENEGDVMTMNLSFLAPGVYSMRFESAGGDRTVRIVKR